MYFLGQAFGEFEPQQDPFAAVKFALSSAFLDDRLDELRALVTENHDTGGVSGEPGWIIERKDVDERHEYYAAWPPLARFRAFVDPDMYELANPECFMDRASFLEYVRCAVSAYVRIKPEMKGEVETLGVPSS